MERSLTQLNGQTLSSARFDAETQEWVFCFDGLTLQVASPWRVVSDTEIVIGSEDDGHRFGPASPVEVNQRIMQLLGSSKADVATFNQYGDVEISFGGEWTLQVFNGSCGYEGWQLHGPGDGCIVAQGGGRVVDSDDEQ